MLEHTHSLIPADDVTRAVCDAFAVVMLTHAAQLPSVAASRCAGRACTQGKPAVWFQPPQPSARRPRAAGLRVHAQSPEQLRAEYERLLATDPAAAEAMRRQAEAYQKALSTPEAQQEMAAMTHFLSNPALKEKLAAMKDDPEFADFFEALKTQGALHSTAAASQIWRAVSFIHTAVC